MKNEIKIFDTTDYMSYDDYKQLCNDNDWDIAPEGSEEYWDTVTVQMRWDIVEFWDNLKYSKLKDEQFFITGHLGLWNGTPEINPVVVSGIHEAISRCVCDDSTIDFDVNYLDGEIYVRTHHHDGTNCFTINRLSSHGRSALDRLYVNEKGWVMYPNKDENLEIKRDWIKRIRLEEIC